MLKTIAAAFITASMASCFAPPSEAAEEMNANLQGAIVSMTIEAVCWEPMGTQYEMYVKKAAQDLAVSVDDVVQFTVKKGFEMAGNIVAAGNRDKYCQKVATIIKASGA